MTSSFSHQAALSPEGWVSVAEQSMERGGHTGQQFNIPTAYLADAKERGLFDAYGQPDGDTLQREYSKDAEDFVHNVLQEEGYAPEGKRIKVMPTHWDLRKPGSGQALTDGYNHIGLAGNDTHALSLLHEVAHILTRTPEHTEAHGPLFQETAHRLYHKYISPEAAQVFAGLIWPDGDGPDPSTYTPRISRLLRQAAALPPEIPQRLQQEYDDWAADRHPLDYPNPDRADYGTGWWPNIETFLKDRYPAAHRGLFYGLEDAQPLLDNPGGNHPWLKGKDPYEGSEALERYGYDPSEIAAGMLLLHNQAHGRREKFYDADVQRLTDIARKRQKMQRDYEQRTGATDGIRLAITQYDVYDSFYDEDFDPEDLAEPHDGPWYHYSPHSLPVGTHLTIGHPSPWGDNYYEKDGTEHRRNYVWLSPSLHEAVGWAELTPRRGQTGPGHIYRVEPTSDVLPWNGSGSDGWVADGAHIAEEIPHPWKEPHAAGVTVRTAASHRTAALKTAADLDDIYELLGIHDDTDSIPPAPPESHDPIPGVPQGWERYYKALVGQPDDTGTAHLHLPVDVLDHYKEYDRDPNTDQARALAKVISDDGGIRSPVHISTDGTHALMHEGNNRLALAKQLGITHLPVRVTYERPGRVIRNEGTPVPLEKNLGGWLDANRHRLTSFFEGQREQYPQRTATRKTAADLAQEYTDNLNKEFHDWVAENGSTVGGWGADNPGDYTKPMGGPLTYWDNIEGFFKDRYPEAYRGFNMAEEKARPLLDYGRATWNAQTMKAPPYETGPEAIEKYGYDPKALAAAMMYLHTWSHAQSAQNAWRGDKLPRDIDRLTNIFQKRQQMQEDYRQRTAANDNWHGTCYWCEDFNEGPLSWGELQRLRLEHARATGGDEEGQGGHVSVVYDGPPPPRGKTAATQYLLPDMPSRRYMPSQPLPPDPEIEGDWWRNSDWMTRGIDANGLDREGYDEDGFDADGFDRDGFNADGYDREGYDEEGLDENGLSRYWSDPMEMRWMHVSPHKLEPGTVLTPGGGRSPYSHQMAPGHHSNVWIDFPENMGRWREEMAEHSPDSQFHYYYVSPDEKPEPNSFGRELGWAVPSARVIEEAQDFDTDNFLRTSSAKCTGGDCYEAAANYLLSNADNPDLRIVHGEVAGQGPLEGVTFGHAWIEDGDTVIDNSNGRQIRMPKADYYALGQIDRINNIHSYRPQEAMHRMLDTQVYGPWDLIGKDVRWMESPDDDEMRREAGWDEEEYGADYDDTPYFAAAWDDEDDDEPRPRRRRTALHRQLPEKTDPRLHTRIPHLPLDGPRNTPPATERFQEFLDAGMDDQDPAEALEEYLSLWHPEERMYYDQLQNYIGQPETDSYPYASPTPPLPGLGQEPYATITYPPGYELEYDDPRPGRYYALKKVEGDRGPHLTAAVNQDLVDRLKSEFQDWWHGTGKAIPAEDGWGQPSYEAHRGPVGWWPNVENFLKQNYPAAHKGMTSGWEQAGRMMDSPEEVLDLPRNKGKTPYETGPEAVSRHGYDPKEIAAGMLLLHNQSHPFRGDLTQQDQDRLNDIFQKRQQMQRDYESRQAHRTAMPDDDYDELYHFTDNPHFSGPHPDHEPATISEFAEPGIYLTNDPHNSSVTGGERPYMATFRVPSWYEDHPGFEPDHYGSSGDYFVRPEWFHELRFQGITPNPINRQASHRTAMPGNDDAWRIAATERGKWYHVSPHKLPNGTVLKPAGGKSPWGEGFYRDRPGEQDHVWVGDGEWMQNYGFSDQEQMPYVYEVEPSETPRHYYLDKPQAGYVTPSAKILRMVDDSGDTEGSYNPPPPEPYVPETQQEQMDRYIRPWYQRPDWSPDEPSPFSPEVDQEYRKRYRPKKADLDYLDLDLPDAGEPAPLYRGAVIDLSTPEADTIRRSLYGGEFESLTSPDAGRHAPCNGCPHPEDPTPRHPLHHGPGVQGRLPLTQDFSDSALATNGKGRWSRMGQDLIDLLGEGEPGDWNEDPDLAEKMASPRSRLELPVLMAQYPGGAIHSVRIPHPHTGEWREILPERTPA